MKYLVIVVFAMCLIASMIVQSAHATTKGIWLSTAEIQSKPMSGPAWDNLVKYAKGSWGSAKLSDQDSNHDVFTLAGAIYYVRTGDTTMRDKVASALFSIPETENGGRTLALGRNLVSYIIAADLIDLASYNPSKEQTWRTWLSNVRNETLDGLTLIRTHEQRPNNWGTNAGASRIAADMYLGDTTDLAKAAKVFQGWLGDRSAYASFKWGDLSWQCDPKAPVGVNPSCIKSGHNIDGALPDDMRRGGSFTWPPKYTNYAWGALGPALVEGTLLERAGYPAYTWSNSALKRAVSFMDRLDKEFPSTGWWASGDDEWAAHLANYAYPGNGWKEKTPARYGKSMGWTDYTH